MSSIITSERGSMTAPSAPQDDVSRLRCRGEGAALALCIATSLVIVLACLVIVLFGKAWLGTHPVLGKHIGWIRAVAIAAIIALPATLVGRRTKLHAARNQGVRVGETQFPELHRHLLDACRKLGITVVPDVYVSHEVDGLARAYSVLGGRPVVVVNASLVPARWMEGLEWIAFAMVRELGALRLGHRRWWIELATVYSRHIPGVRTPLLIKSCYSCDRCAAYVYPEGIRGLVAQGVGKNVIRSVAIPAFIDETKHAFGFWDFIASVLRNAPLLTARAGALYDAGLFDRARDLERYADPPAS